MTAARGVSFFGTYINEVENGKVFSNPSIKVKNVLISEVLVVKF